MLIGVIIECYLHLGILEIPRGCRAVTCLVFIMTPGLAMFYGGLLRKKNVIAMFGLCFSAAFIVAIAWWLFGYSIAFGQDINGIVGSLNLIGLGNVIGVTWDHSDRSLYRV